MITDIHFLPDLAGAGNLGEEILGLIDQSHRYSILCYQRSLTWSFVWPCVVLNWEEHGGCPKKVLARFDRNDGTLELKMRLFMIRSDG